MGYFIITLPNNRKGEVRWGTIKKVSFLLDLFRSNKLKDEAKKGYIIKIIPPHKDQNEYRLLKTKEGKWSTEGLRGFQLTADDDISAPIKTAIDEYEISIDKNRLS